MPHPEERRLVFFTFNGTHSMYGSMAFLYFRQHPEYLNRGSSWAVQTTFASVQQLEAGTVSSHGIMPTVGLVGTHGDRGHFA
jgi:hypothetical protein